MFNRLMQKWKVGWLQLILILITFALGGSLCGYAGKWLMQFTGFTGVLWVIVYILLVTILWPLCVLLVSVPMGQFPFFRNYIRKIGSRLFSRKSA